ALLTCALVVGALGALAEESARTAKTIAFDAPPPGWKARPADARGYLCDFDLDGGARVNVIRFAVDFETLRSKLGHRWKNADGSEIALEKLPTEKRSARGIPITLVALEGTHTPKDEPAHEGWELVCAHLDAPGGAFSAWLLGPKKA